MAMPRATARPGMENVIRTSCAGYGQWRPPAARSFTLAKLVGQQRKQGVHRFLLLGAFGFYLDL